MAGRLLLMLRNQRERLFVKVNNPDFEPILDWHSIQRRGMEVIL